MNEPSRRGFASIPVDRRAEISRQGGKSVAKEKRFFSRDPETARAAGRKGGMHVRAADDRDAKLMREAANGILVVPFGASGRTMVKISRLLRLGYLVESDERPADESHVYLITEAGSTFLGGATSA